MNLLLDDVVDEYIVLLINTISMSNFNTFVTNICQKKNWSEELCCCYFETQDDGYEYYRFETFEGDTYKLSYEKFLDYVKLAIIRFYLGSEDDGIKKSIADTVKNTVFDSCLDNIDMSLATDTPLIG